MEGNATAMALLHDMQESITITWTMLCTFLAISMQLGFAMLEVGSVREAHRMTVLVKNVMDSTVSCLAFWVYLHWGNDGIVRDANGEQRLYLKLSQWAFCATGATICSGSMAERTHVTAYLMFAAVMAGVIYPVLATSVWTTEGLLQSEFHSRFHEGYRHHDFAGGGVVHISGGCAAFVGCALLGRRIVRPLPPQPLHGRRSVGMSPGSSGPGVVQPGGGPGRSPEASPGSLFGDLEEQDERKRMMLRPPGGCACDIASPCNVFGVNSW